MTDAAEQLAGANPRTTNYDGAGAQGVPRHDAVAFALASAKKQAPGDPVAALIMLKYGNGSERERTTVLQALADAEDMDRKGWESTTANWTLCNAALIEFLEARNCPTCDGRGYHEAGDKLEECQDCEGTGRKLRGATERARLIGLKRSTFEHRPAERMYLQRLTRLFRWEEIGLGSAARRLKAGTPHLPKPVIRVLRLLMDRDQLRVSRNTYIAVCALPGVSPRLRFEGRIGFVAPAGDEPLGLLMLKGKPTEARAAIQRVLDVCGKT